MVVVKINSKIDECYTKKPVKSDAEMPLIQVEQENRVNSYLRKIRSRLRRESNWQGT
jgi:hypothetical protein